MENRVQLPSEVFSVLCIPFRLQGAPAVFMQLINEILHEHLLKGGLYLDNILIYCIWRLWQSL